MQKKTLLILAGSLLTLIIIGFLGLMFLVDFMAAEYPEKIYKEMRSPDGTMKLTISHYKQYVPYGVKGNIYLEKNGEQKKVRGFFLDFIEDIDDEIGVKWSEEEKAFYYGTEKLGAD